jgi:hypothetical protein
MRRLLLFVLVVWSATGHGGDFYRQFLILVDTNQPGALPVASPLLIDTNNSAPKLTNTLVNLSNACARGEIAGVRLGMTMEEVAARWGKPQSLWGRCYGGPRFYYTDASVIFDPSSNSVMRIFTHRLPRLDGGLSASSSAEQFEAVLGKPVARQERPRFDLLDLIYQSPLCTLRVDFDSGWPRYIQLDRLTATSEATRK